MEASGGERLKVLREIFISGKHLPIATRVIEKNLIYGLFGICLGNIDLYSWTPPESGSRLSDGSTSEVIFWPVWVSDIEFLALVGLVRQVIGHGTEPAGRRQQPTEPYRPVRPKRVIS